MRREAVQLWRRERVFERGSGGRTSGDHNGGRIVELYECG